MTSETKIRSREELAIIREASRARGLRVGYTSGVFDLVHPGHVDYLERAKAECDILIVGVNSDESVKMYKSENRPICGENDRALVVAGLGCVDYVFIFAERNNNRNVEILKPDVYVKAGDYSAEKLSSASIVEQHGGKVSIVQFKPGYSSTAIIRDVLKKEGGSQPSAVFLDPAPKASARAVFLDRDGTLNEEIDYLHELEKFRVIEGSWPALKKLKQAGFRLVIVTNQPGIGLGYFTKEDFFRVNKELLKQATAAEVAIDRIYFCPHNKADNCTCRKPSPGLIERAVADLNIELKGSYVVGDMTSDVQLAKNAGCKSLLVRTGKAGRDGLYFATPEAEVDNLAAAADWILADVERSEPIKRSVKHF